MVCDAAEASWTRAAEMAPDGQVVADVDEVLNAPVQGVVIATPAQTHYELAEQALEAAKHVRCEKPLALTYEQGAELLRLAERQGCILMVGHVLQYHPGIVRLLELVRGGELGKVHYIYCNRLSLGKVRRIEVQYCEWRAGDQPVYVSEIRKARRELDGTPWVSCYCTLGQRMADEV